MKFNRMLTAGLLALFCAGTASASELNAVRVTPKGNTATVTLQTSGSFAHKEYRPDAHLLLVDLTGVASNAKLPHTVALNSPALKSYAISSYTNAAGTVVTRIEFALGDKVSASVVDAKEGLEIQIKPGNAAPASPAKIAPPAGSAAVAATKATPNPAAKPVSLPHPAAPVAPPAHPAAVAQKANPELTTIRGISVQQQPNSLDVVIEGPTTARAYRLNNPERLVLDFNHSVMQAGVKNFVAVHTADVLRVRAGHANDNSRVVIDLTGPRSFEVLPSADHVTVRIKTEAVAPVAAAKPEVAKKPAHVQRVAMPVASTPVAVAHHAEAHPAEPAAPKVARPAPATVAAPVPSQPAAAPVAAASVPAATAQPLQIKPVPSRPEQAALEMARVITPAIPASITGGSASPSAHALKYTGEPISVNLKDVDLKDFFRLIHEISGLNVVLDPSVRGSVTLVLDDVPWDQALDIVLKNNGLDRELQGNVLRIAATDTLRREALDRRAQAEAVALAVDRQTITRTLSYAKAGAAAATIKKFLTARGDVISDERTNSLIISDIPSVLPTIDHLIGQLDKKTQEVEIEVRVVSASRTFSRDIGFQLGFNWGNGVSTVSGSNPNSAIPPVIPGVPVNNIPLFSNFPAAGATTGLAFTNITKSYAIDAILTAAETHSLAKVLSRPRVVTQSNMKAEIKQGVEIPVYTTGTANINSSVTYTDAVLRLSVLPQVTADRTIMLTVNVENTQPDGQINSNFILSTQQATTQVLVTDGATVVIGGVIQTNNRVTVNQTPLLGNIPWLGNLFKERSVSTDTEELIFFITPKIIET